MSEEKLVIFDLDNTILNGDSDYSMINFLVAKSILDNSALDVNQSFIDDYKKGKLDFDEDRYTDNEELRFCLRAIEKYLPWFRKIFIASNCSKPKWLIENSNLSWVDHSEFIDKSTLFF